MGSTLEVVTALLDQGADIEAKEGTGKTPLLLAISTEFFKSGSWAPNRKVVNYLLERGADPHAVDDLAKKAFQLADERNHKFSETGKFERSPLPPRSSHKHNIESGRGRGKRRWLMVVADFI